MTYAGNVAAALSKCAEKLAVDRSLQKELVLITDATPIANVYDAVVLPIRSVSCSNAVDKPVNALIQTHDESGCSDKSCVNEKPTYHMPFFLFAFFYAIAFVYSWITDVFSRTNVSRRAVNSQSLSK